MNRDVLFHLIQRYGYARREGEHQGMKSAAWMHKIEKWLDANDREIAVSEAENKRLRAENERLRAALEFAHVHVDELCDAWERGAISEHDGKGGLRSNRNAAVEMKIREVLKEPAN